MILVREYIKWWHIDTGTHIHPTTTHIKTWQKWKARKEIFLSYTEWAHVYFNMYNYSFSERKWLHKSNC